jgi:outer membrane autotransporter protein
MSRTNFLMFLVATTVAWSPASFAQRQTAVGPGIIPLNATGVLGGVDLSVSGTTGTLNVGVPGGPQMDIFTLNNPVVAGRVAVSTAASSQGNIVFNSSSTVYGAIGVTQPGGPFLLNIAGGNAGTTVNFMGPVFATTLGVSGTGAVNFNSGSTNVTATNFAADGTISLAPNSIVIGALTTTAGANTGTLSLGGGSVLNGAVGGAVGLKSIAVAGGSNTAGVTATITGAVDVFALSLGTNTLNIGGALTIANIGANGVINTVLASPTVYGNIRPLGTTNLGPALGINVTVPATAFIPVGTQFNIIQTQAGTQQSGTNGSVVTITVKDPTNPLYTFAAVPAAGTIAGLVTIRTTGIPLMAAITPPAGTGTVQTPTVPVAAAIVPVLLAIAPAAAPTTPGSTPTTPAAAPTSDLVATVLPAINALVTPGAVIDAVTQLAPSTPDLVAPLVTFQGTREFEGLWQSRLDDIMCGGVSETDRADRPERDSAYCHVNVPRSGLWVKGFGYFGDQENRGQSFGGYNSKIYGGMIGYDMPLGDDTRAGLGIGYARSTIDGSQFNDRTSLNTYQATAYLLHEMGPWFVTGDLSVGLSDYSGSRSIVFPGVNRTAHAGYDGQDYTAYAATGYHFYAGGFAITPLASLQYTHVNADGYTETGAGDVNLAIRSQSYDFLESGLGVKVARDFQSDSGTFVPEIHFKWLRALNNPTLKNTAAFAVAGSPSFTTPGLKTADDTLDLGAGVTLLSNGRTWALEAAYDYQWRSDQYSAHQGMVKFTYRFGGEPADVCDCATPVRPAIVAATPSVAKSYLVFFDFNRSDLTPQAVAIVGQAAHNAGPAKVTRLEVTGHTDTVGSDAYNMRLSRRRAESVAAELEKDGIPAGEIAIFAKGKRDLLVPTADGVKEPQNRRVQITYSDGGPAA